MVSNGGVMDMPFLHGEPAIYITSVESRAGFSCLVSHYFGGTFQKLCSIPVEKPVLSADKSC